jgi:flagellar hook-associated protein 1 FlgK
MGGLFASLQTSSTALEAFSQALGVDQSNIANASTPGYASQTANIQPIATFGNGAGSNGGDFITVTSTGSAFSDAVVQAASSQASASSTQAAQLSPIDQLFDITGSTGILAAFQQFSSAFANLSVSPSDPVAGAEALAAAGNVASAFQTVAASLNTQSTQVASSIQSTTAQINALSADISQLNIQTAGSAVENPATDANLRSDLDQLSSLVDITVSTAPNGSVSVLAGGELPLVLGDQSYALSASLSGAPGTQIFTQITSAAGGDAPASFSGQLGALLQTQNGTIAQLAGGNGQPGSLNTLAQGFADLVNDALTSGTNAAGGAGVPIFTYNAANPAGTLAVDPTVTAAQLGLASATESNGVANELAALPGSTAAADQIGGQSAEGLFSAIAASVGQQLSDANTASTADQTTLTTAQTNRQQQSGVSLNQEAVNVTDYERSYEASAQVVSILDQLTEDTINIGTPSTG